MPNTVAVNPGQIVINDGSTFLVTAADGSIDENLPQGLFVRDTRLISYYELTLNRQQLTLLASSNITHHSALYVYTNYELPTLKGKLPKNSLLVNHRRDIVEGMHEDIMITNWHQEDVEFQLMLAIRSDFADIFQVKSKELITRGRIETEWQDNKLKVDYHSESFYRGLAIAIDNATSPPHNANGRLMFDVALAPGETWHACFNYTAFADGYVFEPKLTCTEDFSTAAGKMRDDLLDRAMQMKSSNSQITGLYEQALVDMGALQIKVEVNGENLWMPAAGIPWFMAVFGRDSIIVSLQTLPIFHEFARGTLVKLAQLQGKEIDPERDVQPGKILHELRRGELTQLHELPYSPYYGTIDATPLWIITLAETYKWNGDKEMLSECREPLEKALDWIDEYGDFDDDGFVEYLRQSEHGPKNQGWKDSGKSMVDSDGKQVEPPIALCEVQGEVYKAWKCAADIYQIWGETNRALELRQKADEMKQRFNQSFWMEDVGFYCLGLDSNKQQIKSITSNPGQLLWSGIIPQERADKVVERLFYPDMWCGWGVRTLSSQNPAYNPISYQRGSVWPFDNSFIALGLKQYGFHKQANQIAEGIFAAAKYFEDGRLPEVFAGIERSKDNFPVPYIDANSPQGWSSGAIFLFISTMLGLKADASHKRLTIQPYLPKWLPDLELKNLSVGDAAIALSFWREGEQTKWEVTHLEGELEVNLNN